MPAVVIVDGVVTVRLIGPSEVPLPEQVPFVKNVNVAVPWTSGPPIPDVTMIWSKIDVLRGTTVFVRSAVPLGAWWIWVVAVASQLWNFASTKSFSVAVMDCEERVSCRKLPKHSSCRLYVLRSI